MSINKLALIRYKVIDDCLRNRYRRWTLEDLIEKVSDVLYETEGIHSGVSRRTIQGDIQVMRSDKLGYNAPIVVQERKYYTYSDPSFSITNAPVNQADVDKMKEVVGVLKQLNGFSYFEEMSEVIARLENNVNQSIHPGRSCIQFESNQRLKGLSYIGRLYQAVLQKKPLLINYRSFKARQARDYTCYPYLLKEYRNRWFLITRHKQGKDLMVMALDRMESLQELSSEPFMEYEGIDFDRYYSDVLGVTKGSGQRPQKIVLWVEKQHAPYVLTKPIHQSQQLLKEDETGILIGLDLVVNFELEREILGFGEHVKVLSPRLLAKHIRARQEAASNAYRQGDHDA